MWASVPEDFDMIKIMKEAYTSATGKDQSELGVVELEDCLLNELADKKFLLILDDVWNENYDRWNKLKQLFTQEANGSKIVVTTRSSQVTSITGTVDSYLLEGLSPEDCLSLFVKFAFRDETVRFLVVRV
ncbi:putative disease resistance protein RGA3 [Pistacia vera]|uniref:putative disease resistance protein RGA3 n=1 Tax=Pistacia vera TaxID=55513 RepID=UPI001262D38D|nr:putative disease resistance protein RGA3 [Pistacia vera]